jgi:peptide deformylase
MEIIIPKEYQPFYEQNGSPIVFYPDPVLRRKAKPLSRLTSEISHLIDHMLEAMESAQGIGLAAPQVGVSIRLCIIAPPDKPARVLINPQVMERHGEQIGTEGCLSLPAVFGEVPRSEAIIVRALNRRGKPIQLRLEGVEAKIVLHEIDHLDGILFIDRAIRESLYWQLPEEEEEGGNALARG